MFRSSNVIAPSDGLGRWNPSTPATAAAMPPAAPGSTVRRSSPREAEQSVKAESDLLTAGEFALRTPRARLDDVALRYSREVAA